MEELESYLPSYLISSPILNLYLRRVYSIIYSISIQLIYESTYIFSSSITFCYSFIAAFYWIMIFYPSGWLSWIYYSYILLFIIIFLNKSDSMWARDTNIIGWSSYLWIILACMSSSRISFLHLRQNLINYYYSILISIFNAF